MSHLTEAHLRSTDPGAKLAARTPPALPVPAPLFVLALLATASADAHPRRSVAFFYGKPVPVSQLARFDWIVLEPANVSDGELSELRRAGAEVFAYSSLGETAADVDPAWALGTNPGWNTVIVNPAAEGWRARVFSRADAAAARGFSGLFLDTLDSHAMVLKGSERQATSLALAALIQALHERHPELKLFFNRGFELLDDVGHLAAAIAAESLFHRWDPATKRYVDVPAADRVWLAKKLSQVTARFRFPVVVIDYLPRSRLADARAAARRIDAMGFIPWISTAALDTVGVGAPAEVNRVLLVHDGAEAQGPVLAAVAERLRSLGCEADPVDVRQGLPETGEHVGVVGWFADDELPDALGYQRWLTRQLDAGVPVAMLGRPGFVLRRPLLARLGLAPAPETAARIERVVSRGPMVGHEAEPTPRTRGLSRWHAAEPGVTVHLRVADEAGEIIDPVVTAPWGGMALQPYFYEYGYQGRLRWIVDPSAFLRAALVDVCAPKPPAGEVRR